MEDSTEELQEFGRGWRAVLALLSGDRGHHNTEFTARPGLPYPTATWGGHAQ